MVTNVAVKIICVYIYLKFYMAFLMQCYFTCIRSKNKLLRQVRKGKLFHYVVPEVKNWAITC